MEVKYRNDLYANYMLVEIPESADINSYSFKMIERNSMKGILPAKTRMEDGKGYLYLDISKKRNLIEIYKEKEMMLEDMTKIFQGILPILEELRTYLLTEKMICFDPAYIYEDNEESYSVMLLPWKEESPDFRKLAEFFLEKINHKDEHGVNAAYHFYRQQSQTLFSIYHFIQVLEKENIMKRQKKSQAEKLEFMPIPEINESEEVSEEPEEFEYEYKKINRKGKRKYVLLVLSLICLSLQFINSISHTIKISLMAVSLLLILLFFIVIILKKEKHKDNEMKEKEEIVYSEKEDLEMIETVFFEAEKEEEWKLQWKEYGRKKQALLEEFPCKVGKIKGEVGIVMNDVSVSRLHCQFVKKENKITIMDLNSTNGTYLNGMRLEQGEILEIEKNDEILIGKVKVLVV